MNPTGDCRWRGSGNRRRLQSVQVIDRLAGVRSGGEDCPLVVFEDLQPIVDVAGVVLANLRRDVQVSTEKRGADPASNPESWQPRAVYEYILLE